MQICLTVFRVRGLNPVSIPQARAYVDLRHVLRVSKTFRLASLEDSQKVSTVVTRLQIPPMASSESAPPHVESQS